MVTKYHFWKNNEKNTICGGCCGNVWGKAFGISKAPATPGTPETPGTRETGGGYCKVPTPATRGTGGVCGRPEKLDVVGWFINVAIWDFQVSRSFLLSSFDFCDLSLLGVGDLWDLDLGEVGDLWELRLVGDLSGDLWDLDLGEVGDLWELRLGEIDLSSDLWDLDLGEGDLWELRLGEQGNLLRGMDNKTDMETHSNSIFYFLKPFMSKSKTYFEILVKKVFRWHLGT